MYPDRRNRTSLFWTSRPFATPRPDPFCRSRTGDSTRTGFTPPKLFCLFFGGVGIFSSSSSSLVEARQFHLPINISNLIPRKKKKRHKRESYHNWPKIKEYTHIQRERERMTTCNHKATSPDHPAALLSRLKKNDWREIKQAKFSRQTQLAVSYGDD